MEVERITQQNECINITLEDIFRIVSNLSELLVGCFKTEQNCVLVSKTLCRCLAPQICRQYCFPVKREYTFFRPQKFWNVQNFADIDLTQAKSLNFIQTPRWDISVPYPFLTKIVFAPNEKPKGIIHLPPQSFPVLETVNFQSHFVVYPLPPKLKKILTGGQQWPNYHTITHLTITVTNYCTKVTTSYTRFCFWGFELPKVTHFSTNAFILVSDWPETLTHLDFSKNFHIFPTHLIWNPIIETALPLSLTHIYFYQKFDEKIDFLENLVCLKSVKFGSDFNRSIQKLPFSIVKLEVGNNFNSEHLKELSPDMKLKRLVSHSSVTVIPTIPATKTITQLLIHHPSSQSFYPPNLTHMFFGGDCTPQEIIFAIFGPVFYNFSIAYTQIYAFENKSKRVYIGQLEFDKFGRWTQLLKKIRDFDSIKVFKAI